MGIPLRVLIVEDSNDDTELLLSELRRSGYDPTYEQVQTAESMTAALTRQEWDVVIADYRLPRFSAPAALELLQGMDLDLPFIIVSGNLGEDIAVASMKAGAHDYLMKADMSRLVPAIERELRDAGIRREHARIEERLRQSEERFRQLAENIQEVFWMTDAEKSEVLYVSPAYEKIWGRSCQSLYENPTNWMEAIHPDDRDKVMNSAMTDQVDGGYDEEYRIVRPDGATRWIRDRAFPVRDRFGQVYRITGVADDITERKLTEDALRNAKEFSEYLIQTANVIILGLDTRGNIQIFNEAAEKITGYTRSELQGKNWFDILTPKERYPGVWEEFVRLAAGGTPRLFENPILTRSGEERYITWQNSQIRKDGEIVATISFGNDITERKRAEEALKESEERLRMAIDAAYMYTWDWDLRNDRIIRSGHQEKIYGPGPYVTESDYTTLLNTIYLEDRTRVDQAVKAALREKSSFHVEFRILRADGSIHWLETRGQAYCGATGKAVRMMGVTQDITERKRAEELVKHMAFYDTLTALPNRNNLRDSVLLAIQENEDSGTPLALLLLDLNHFREINDTLGHNYGDLVLIEVGRRLQSLLFPPDVVARLGGDEFAILLPRLARPGDVHLVIQKIQQAFSTPVMIDDLPVAVEASIGVALYPEHGGNPDTLLQRADVAMYTSKKAGSSYVIYDRAYDRHSTERLALMAELREAIEQDQLVLYYQPKVNLGDRTVAGVEALVRWKHPQRDMIPPDLFIGPAEHTGLIHPLTRWVLQAAFRQCGEWARDGKKIPMAINLSARNLYESWLPDRIAQLMQEHGVAAEWITLEITESAIMIDPDRAVEILLQIHGTGIQISIDDFGIGYSSLNYLRKLPVDTVKVDKSFVLHMLQNSSDAMIVRSTIELAHNLGIAVVAEGVENESTYNRLVEWGCDAVQGYYLSRPLPPDQFIRWLAESPWEYQRT